MTSSASHKAALEDAISKALHETIGSPVEWIYVLIRETPGSHHWHGGHALPEYAPDV